MTICAVFGCQKRSDNKDWVPQSPIEWTTTTIDDAGTVLDGKNLKFFRMPSMKAKKLTSQELNERKNTVLKWTYACKRELRFTKPENWFICSAHFPREAYDQFVAMKHNGFLNVPPSVRILKPLAIPTINLPDKICEAKRKYPSTFRENPESSRAKRMKRRERKELVEQAIKDDSSRRDLSNTSGIDETSAGGIDGIFDYASKNYGSPVKTILY
ncbi:uncharacterized protein LOC135943161 isoform X2 [Cloeon dipterum]|uniref:uncharacterized protein LOC135943161 isoform X2 n=1 Tax=Cloeon dipterum TaxID=197152 RepID=UPI00321FC443